MSVALGARAPVGARRLAPSTAGVLVLVAAWEVVGRVEVFGAVWPPLSRVLDVFGDGIGRETLRRAALQTCRSAGLGFGLGTVVAVGLAIVGAAFEVLECGIMRLATLLHAVPVVVVAPLLITSVDRGRVPMLLAAFGASFPTLVACQTGMQATVARHGDLFEVLGAKRWAKLARLQVPLAVPLTLDGARLGACAAMLGTIFGEWFGAPRGLGVLLISTMRSGNVVLLWAVALLTSVITLTAYGLLTAAHVFVDRRLR